VSDGGADIARARLVCLSKKLSFFSFFFGADWTSTGLGMLLGTGLSSPTLCSATGSIFLHGVLFFLLLFFPFFGGSTGMSAYSGPGDIKP